jgi:hypothetical protein
VATVLDLFDFQVGASIQTFPLRIFLSPLMAFGRIAVIASNGPMCKQRSRNGVTACEAASKLL